MAHQEACYVCLQEATEENPFMDPHPCYCRGSIKLHQTCYKELETATDNCGICKKQWNKNGTYTTYYSNANKKTEINYVDGKRHGLYQEWHENGQKAKEINYTDGLQHGLYQQWYNNGQKAVHVEYINGKEQELYQAWWGSGQRAVEINYIDGMAHGLIQAWHKNGQKLELPSSNFWPFLCHA